MIEGNENYLYNSNSNEDEFEEDNDSDESADGGNITFSLERQTDGVGEQTALGIDVDDRRVDDRREYWGVDASEDDTSAIDRDGDGNGDGVTAFSPVEDI